MLDDPPKATPDDLLALSRAPAGLWQHRAADRRFINSVGEITMVYTPPIRLNAWVARSGQPGQAPAGDSDETVAAIKEARLAIEGVPDTWRPMRDQERGE